MYWLWFPVQHQGPRSHVLFLQNSLEEIIDRIGETCQKQSHLVCVNLLNPFAVTFCSCQYDFIIYQSAAAVSLSSFNREFDRNFDSALFYA